MYPVITEFLGECKVPRERFLVYPQLALPWKPDEPEDRHEEIPDFAVGNFDFANAPGTPLQNSRRGGSQTRSSHYVGVI